ncbi:MAG: glycosyltransferase [Lachnospiraceae bacterium]|nr:glycosyltransferase [Lachnospiraceae bacterium]MDE7204837.1 glycosyltransferase [Lachnospiraceae bacterium]
MRSISVIMPLYNAGKFLAEALQSVLNQTGKDFELICINDCSTDDTRKILCDFQERDKRIRILDNEYHLGAAPSRNKGLNAAEGKYILFLDGDDIFEEELLEKTSKTIEKYQADIVIFEYMHTPSDEINKKRVKEHSADYVEKFCRTPFSVCDCTLVDFSNWSSSPCDKLFRKSFLRDNYLEFQDLPSFNDVYFAKMALFCAGKIICLDDDRVMVYARDHDEPSRISRDRNPMCAYYAIEKLAKELKERNMMEKCFIHLYHFMANTFWSLLIYGKDGKRSKDFCQFLHDKGIADCIAYGKEFYDRIEIYDKYIIENFQNKAYDSRWFEHMDTYFECYLKHRGQILRRFINEKLQQDKKIIVWGIGKNGTSLLKYLNEHFIKVYAAVDTNEEKQGITVCGYEVSEPHEICAKADYVLAVGKPVYLHAEKIMKDSNVRVINVFDLLEEKDGIL